jgi:AraC-like DNA-binding protein
MDAIDRLRRRLVAHLDATSYSRRPCVLPLPMLVSAGVERQSDPARYQWDGLRRSWDTKCPRGVPHIVVQYTLAGEGRYADARGERSLPPGSGFIAPIPSAHRYWLPPGRIWEFCWFAVAHPQLVERLSLVARDHGPVFACEGGSALAERIAGVVEGLFREDFLDDFALEAALWDVQHELDRHADRIRRPPDAKQDLLDRVRALVFAELGSALGAGDIAQRLGWHRVHFAQRFRAATGFTPAAYITSLRLEEARRRLGSAGSTLDQVAHATGLGSASHLCRLFRRHYGGTPGQFRG